MDSNVKEPTQILRHPSYIGLAGSTTEPLPTSVAAGPLYTAGVAESSLQQLLSAVELLRRRAASQPTAQTYADLARALTTLNRLDEAIDAARRVVELAPP